MYNLHKTLIRIAGGDLKSFWKITIFPLLYTQDADIMIN